MSLHEFHQRSGAQVAPDGIPLSYHDAATEYQAALNHAILLDRSHEARLALAGGSRAAFLQRMSTNDILNLPPSAGRPTIFTNANARIVHRAVVYPHPAGDSLWLIGGPGRGDALRDYLARQIFYGDDVQITDLSATTAHFALHGVTADALVREVFGAPVADLPPFGCASATLDGVPVVIARDKPLTGGHWRLIAPRDAAPALWQALLDRGAPHGLLAAGSLTYNTLRIRAGMPGYGAEIAPEYIPLEVGLWDEVSFSKGCYTGQEIIARMESRNRLARTLVRLALSAPVRAPAELRHEGRPAGTLTSCAQSPDGTIHAMAVVKTAHATPGTTLTVGDQPASVVALLGAQPALPQ